MSVVPVVVKHGTETGYSVMKCRCTECRAAHAVAHREYMEARKARVLAGDERLWRHGATGFRLGCRCEDCVSAHESRPLAGLAGLRTKEPGACACCGRVRRLVVDHDHETGLFRGYICSGCNTGIGNLGDTIEGLERALAYLRGVGC